MLVCLDADSVGSSLDVVLDSLLIFMNDTSFAVLFSLPKFYWRFPDRLSVVSFCFLCLFNLISGFFNGNFDYS